MERSDPNPGRLSAQLTFGGIFLIAAPFVGDGGWHSEDIEPLSDLGAKLPEQTPIYLYHGSKDKTAPFEHVRLYAKAIPQAVVRRLSGRDHQLNNDMSEVAADIRRLPAVRLSQARPVPRVGSPANAVTGVHAMAKKRPQRRWVRRVKTDSTHPPPRTFAGSASQIARTMARRDVSPKGLGSAIRMIQDFINRGGRRLSASRRRELERAKRILQRRRQSAG